MLHWYICPILTGLSLPRRVGSREAREAASRALGTGMCYKRVNHVGTAVKSERDSNHVAVSGATLPHFRHNLRESRG